DSVDPEGPPPYSEAVLQPESADSGAAYSGSPECAAAGGRRPAIRSDAQLGRRADAARDRDEEPEDAARIDREPPRVQRTPGPRARERGRLQTNRRARTDLRHAAGRRHPPAADGCWRFYRHRAVACCGTTGRTG